MYFLIRHRLNGLVVRLALWSGEVPGSNQGGTFFYEKFFIIFQVAIFLNQNDIPIIGNSETSTTICRVATF